MKNNTRHLLKPSSVGKLQRGKNVKNSVKNNYKSTFGQLQILFLFTNQNSDRQYKNPYEVLSAEI